MTHLVYDYDSGYTFMSHIRPFELNKTGSDLVSQMKQRPANIRDEFHFLWPELMRSGEFLLHDSANIIDVAVGRATRVTVRGAIKHIPSSIGTAVSGVPARLNKNMPTLFTSTPFGISLNTTPPIRLAEIVECRDNDGLVRTIAVRATSSGSTKRDRGLQILCIPETSWDINDALREAGADNVGHVIMCPREVYNPKLFKIQKWFEDSGGRIVQFEHTRKQILDAYNHYFPPIS